MRAEDEELSSSSAEIKARYEDCDEPCGVIQSILNELSDAVSYILSPYQYLQMHSPRPSRWLVLAA